jgi:hypothetical protein
MIKADRKGKASGLENLKPYHRMESMRKSNILFLEIINTLFKDCKFQ